VQLPITAAILAGRSCDDAILSPAALAGLFFVPEKAQIAGEAFVRPEGRSIRVRVLETILGLLLLAGAIAGCSAPPGGGAAQQDYNYNLGSCYNSGLGPGYSRDFSYGDRYVSGQNRQC
jgi:hypothetical protein